MGDIKICRICLNKDVKLFQLDHFGLRHYYEQIMNIKMQQDNLPQWLCFECAALLHKYHKFKEKCSYGQSTLKNLFCKGFMTYEVIDDIRKNRDDLLSSVNYITPNKHVKTYHIKHKPEKKPSQIENILISEFGDDFKYEYIPETDDENTPLDKLKYRSVEKNLKSEIPPITDEPDYVNYDDAFDLESLGPLETDNNEVDIKINEVLIKTDFPEQDIVINGNKNLEINTEDKLLTDDGRDSLLLSLLNTKPKRSKKKSDAADAKPRKFEKKKKARINDDNWEIKILTEDEAFEQFKQRANNTKYIKFNFKCDKCLKGFSRNDILLRHNKQCHDKQGSFECRFCHMLFKRKFQLGRHMVVHYYVYQCLRCDLKCNLLSTAAFHEDYHNGVTRTCKLCGEQFKHVSTYYTHLRMAHRNSHICKLCGASFVSGTGLEFHMKRQHCISEEITEQPANIYCAKCDVAFVSQSAYDEHLTQSNLHEDEQPTRKKRSRKELIEIATTCRYCKERFTTRAECRRHASAQHRGARPGAGAAPASAPAERVMCEICAAWLAPSSIEVHMNRHTKKVIYPCHYCGKEFLCKSGYNTHQAKHTGVRPHACKICHKRFSQKFSMDIHYRRVHLKEPYPKRSRKKNTDEVPLFEKMKWS